MKHKCAVIVFGLISALCVVATPDTNTVANPTDSDGWLKLGLSCNEKREFNDAILAFHQAVKLKPDLPDAWRGLGAACRIQGKMDDAIAAYQQATKLKPDYIRAWIGLALTYEKQGKPDDAKAAYQQAVRLKPNNWEDWDDLGVGYENLGKIDDAITAYRTTTTLKPDYASAWGSLGNMFLLQRKSDDAIVALQQAIKLKPDYEEARVALGLAYDLRGTVCELQGKFDNAVTAFREAVKLKPDDSTAVTALQRIAARNHTIPATTMAPTATGGGLSITTLDGRTYNGVRVTRVDLDGIAITHSTGVTKIMFGNLPESVARHYRPVLQKTAAQNTPPQPASVENDIRIEIIEVERKTEKQIGDAIYEAQVKFNGKEWYLSVFHYPSNVKNDTDRLMKWFDITRRSELLYEKELQEFVNLYAKFLEWNNIAESEHVAPFRKTIIKLSSRPLPPEFVWDGKKAVLELSLLDATEVRLIQELLSNADKIRAEWKTKKTESDKAKQLFK